MSVKSFIDNVNDKIAITITQMVSTMWCVYVFSIMVAIPLFYPDTTTVIMFISSSFLQLAMLPILLVGQRLLSKSSDAQREQDHIRLSEALRHIHQILSADKKERVVLNNIVEDQAIILKTIKEIQSRLISE